MVNDYLVGRSFNVLYIWIDAILLLAFLYVLARTRRRAALVVGLLGGIQFTWEAVLMISGIRPLAWRPLVIDSLIETNLGAPFMLLIVKAWRARHPKEFLVLPAHARPPAA